MHILRDENLQGFNTLALQARAKALVRVSSDEQLPAALRWAADRELPAIALGEGSNIVLAGDVDALLVRLETRGIEVLEEDGTGVVLRIAAGENWHALVQWSLQQGLFGLENLALIPGTVGAAPIQNIGAYGVELGPLVKAVHGVEVADGESFSLSGTDCEFGYRDSVFKQGLRDQLVITAVDLQLFREPRVNTGYPALARVLADRGVEKITPADVFNAVVSIRRSKLPDPAVVPNAGSFFKNPVIGAGQARELAGQFPQLPQYPQPGGAVKLPAAWLIDYCGWKGHSRDGLGVHPEHALVLVNYGSAGGDSKSDSHRGEGLLQLADEVATSVASTFGIQLEIEPRVYGRSV